MKPETSSQLPQSGQPCGLSVAHRSVPECARANTEMDECYVICPHCQEFYQAEGADYSETEREETCEICGGRYMLYEEFTVTHHTRAMPNVKAQRAVNSDSTT
jgi:hypothetical protein